MMGPHCVWLVVVGGASEDEVRDVGGGVKGVFSTFINDPNIITMVIELGK